MKKKNQLLEFLEISKFIKRRKLSILRTIIMD